MPDRKITIAAAARTPLYLPLYVVALNQFLPAHKSYKISIKEPEDKTINGDRWAATQVADQKATFAVCDPLVANELANVRVVASVVDSAAFWFVSREIELHQLSQLASVKTIITYPKEMTGYHVARFISQAAESKISVSGVAVDSELDPVVAQKPGRKSVVALTPNLPLAHRFVQQYPADALRISPAWNLHSTLWTFMLTGLLTHKDTVAGQYEMVTDFVSALSKASAMISLHHDVAARVLIDSYKEKELALTEAEAESVVRQLHATRIHPVTPYPDMTSWHNARLVRPGSKPSVATDRSYADVVHTQSASAVETVFLRTQVRYGEGELHNDLVVSIENLQELRLSDKRVVGSYYRYSDQDRNFLKSVVKRFSEAVLGAPSSVRENFLIWGGSSAGKSYLVEQFAEENAGKFKFVPINVAKESRETVAAKLQELAASSGRRLCLIDEIDAKSSASWSYDLVFSQLDLRTRGEEVVFVLTGSTTESADALAEHIAKEYRDWKGGDLETRIPLGGHVTIPPPVLEDRIIIVVGQMCNHARAMGRKVSEVEKSALYYILLTDGLGKARHLSDLAGASVGRLAENRQLLRYEDLFEEANHKRRQDFYMRHISAFETLGGVFVRVSE